MAKDEKGLPSRYEALGSQKDRLFVNYIVKRLNDCSVCSTTGFITDALVKPLIVVLRNKPLIWKVQQFISRIQQTSPQKCPHVRLRLRNNLFLL